MLFLRTLIVWGILVLHALLYAFYSHTLLGVCFLVWFCFCSLIRSVCGVLSLCFLCLVENTLLALALFPCGFCLSMDLDPIPFIYAFLLRFLELVLPQPGCGYCQNPPPLSVVIKPSGLGSVLLSM